MRNTRFCLVGHLENSGAIAAIQYDYYNTLLFGIITTREVEQMRGVASSCVTIAQLCYANAVALCSRNKDSSKEPLYAPKMQPIRFEGNRLSGRGREFISSVLPTRSRLLQYREFHHPHWETSIMVNRVCFILRKISFMRHVARRTKISGAKIR